MGQTSICFDRPRYMNQAQIHDAMIGFHEDADSYIGEVEVRASGRLVLTDISDRLGRIRGLWGIYLGTTTIFLYIETDFDYEVEKTELTLVPTGKAFDYTHFRKKGKESKPYKLYRWRDKCLVAVAK